jgi:hypothetical protein
LLLAAKFLAVSENQETWRKHDTFISEIRNSLSPYWYSHVHSQWCSLWSALACQGKIVATIGHLYRDLRWSNIVHISKISTRNRQIEQITNKSENCSRTDPFYYRECYGNFKQCADL